MSTLKELRTQLRTAQQALKEHGQNLLLEEARAYLAAHPQAYAIGFRAYAPSFNDGDPCVWHVHYTGVRYLSEGEHPPTIDDLHGEHYFEGNWNPEDVGLPEPDFLDEEVIAASFGEDNYTVIITRDKWSKEYCDPPY